VFRNRERGALHHPEFTLVEWYHSGEPYEALMADCAAILAQAAEAAGTKILSFRGRMADPFAEPERITPRPRQAFLLVALEGFSEDDAAQILDCDLATLRGLVEESGRELAAEIATDVLIIEDETFIAMDIEALVESLGHKVIGVARTHSEAVTLAHKKRPGLILADIQLADGSSGLDAVNELLGSFEVPVIFITAYPERFLTGQRPEPAFLIAKPFQLAVVSAVASQALFFGRKAHLRDRHVAA